MKLRINIVQQIILLGNQCIFYINKLHYKTSRKKNLTEPMFTTAMRSRTSSPTKDKAFMAQRTTSEDEDKVKQLKYQQKSKLIKKLTSHSAQQFRQLNIDEYDLNFTQHFEDLQYIDDAVTPLIYCAHYGIKCTKIGLKEICRFLLKNKNVDVDQQTETNKQTALIVACMTGNYQIVRYLVLAGAQVNKPNSLNNNPLGSILFRLVEEQYSFENKKICFLIAQLLLKNGADPNWVIEKTKGLSLLHYFCASKMKMNKTQKLVNEQIIQFLLNHGANPQQKTLKDQTAFDLIKKHCNKQKIQQLLNEWKQKKIEKQKTRPEEKRKFKTIAQEFLKIQIKSRSSSDRIQFNGSADQIDSSMNKQFQISSQYDKINQKQLTAIRNTQSSNSNEIQMSHYQLSKSQK